MDAERPLVNSEVYWVKWTSNWLVESFNRNVGGSPYHALHFPLHQIAY